MTQYYTADLKINAKQREVWRGDIKISMSPLTFDVLLLLVISSPKLVDSERLLSEVWRGQVVSTETLTQRIAMLRKSLADATSPSYIESIRSRGYRWLPRVSQSPTSLTVAKRRPLTLLISVLAAAAIALFASTLFFTSEKSDTELASTPNFNDERLLQAWSYYGRFDEKSNDIARQLFLAVHKQEPLNVNAIAGISASYSQAMTKFNGGADDLEQSLRFAKLAISVEPKSAKAHWALGFSFDAQGQIEQAIDSYQVSIELDDSAEGVRASLAYLLAIQGELVQALQYNLDAFDSDAHYRHLQIAHTLRLLQFSVLAEKWYRVADELNPDSVFAAVARAEHLYVLGKPQKALDLIESAMNRGIKRAELPILKGIILIDENNYSDALEQFNIAQQLNPSYAETNAWIAWVLAQYESHKQVDEAGISEKFVFITPPSWPSAWVAKAIYLMADSSNEQQALDALQTAFELGFLDHQMLMQLKPFEPLRGLQRFKEISTSMQDKIQRQRQAILVATWLPDDFLDVSQIVVD